jgi:hypothetical protein
MMRDQAKKDYLAGYHCAGFVSMEHVRKAKLSELILAIRWLGGSKYSEQ